MRSSVNVSLLQWSVGIFVRCIEQCGSCESCPIRALANASAVASAREESGSRNSAARLMTAWNSDPPNSNQRWAYIEIYSSISPLGNSR